MILVDRNGELDLFFMLMSNRELVLILQIVSQMKRMARMSFDFKHSISVLNS